MGEKKDPNVIIMYADDLGFGDVGCYGATNIKTPNIDRLASRGILFSQGYATAATCTPSRYSLLTGSYPWRNPRASILAGDASNIINSDTPTMASMFQNAGYHTAVVGKWHMGLGRDNIDWNSTISSTPNDVGFDESFIMAATNDRVPCVYVENRKVFGLEGDDPIEVTYDWEKAFTGEPTGRNNPELLSLEYSHGHDAAIINGVSRIGHMRGGKAALWDDELMAETFVERAVDFIHNNSKDPFFLYYAFHQPHVPRLPSKRFKGSTKLGARGDVIAELDWCVGQIMEALDRLRITENTMIVFSSDNGPVLNDGYKDKAEELNGSHTATGRLRGGKYSMFDGGTRVPFIVSWPGQIESCSSDALISQVDLYACFASIIGQDLRVEDAPDSMPLADTLLGKDEIGRIELVVEGTKAKTILRRNEWVYIPPYEGHTINKNTNIELGNSLEAQLYNLQTDVGQQRNIACDRPDLTQTMSSRLNEILSSECTRQWN
ncbi:MAG: arylsulfatase [Candidatus Latescibacterota bacterium]|nr:arylsulfatase [Candidatus Latescibacterota bacterium]